MKKFIIILLSVLVLLIAAAIVIPIAFKGPLMRTLKNVINENVNATVEFDNLKLNLFRNFPRVYAELQGLSVTGKDQFQGDTLVFAKSISTSLSLKELFGSDGFKIENLTINGTHINLLSTRDGLVNWDIMLSDTTTTAEAGPAGTESSLSLSLNEIAVNDLNLTYKDEASAMLVKMINSNIGASAKLDGNITRIALDGAVSNIIFEYDSTQYLGNTTLKVKSDIEADLDNMSFTLGETTLHLNKLPLNISGKFAMPSDSMFFDLQFKLPKSDFATLLAMVPQSYQSYFEKVQTTGEAGLEGAIKGWSYNSDQPQMNMRLFVANGTFQYDNAPQKINNIEIEAALSKPQGDMDKLVIDVSKARASIQDNPVSLRLNITNPMTDMQFDAFFEGKVDFTKLSNVIALESDSLDMEGILEGKLALKGKMSDIEQERYDKVSSSGEFSFRNFKIQTPQITRPIEVPSGDLKINTTDITLSALNAKTGQSDFLLTGKLSNYLPYFLLNQTLKGDFSLKSNFINTDELTSLMADTNTPETASNADSLTTFSIPAKIDITFRSLISKARFDKMDITNIDGLITMKDEKLVLQKLNMDLLGGEMTLDGTYKSNEANKPEFDFNVNANSFQVPVAYKSFSLMQRYMPIAARSEGMLSSRIGFKGRFDEQFNLVPSSLNGTGTLNIKDFKLLDASLFDQLKGVIKSDKLKNMTVDDFTADFKIQDGNFVVNPFTTRVAGQQATLQGTVSVDNILNLNIDFKVNRADLGDDITKMIGYLPGASNIDFFDVGVLLKGNISNPEVKLDLSRATKQIEEEAKKATKETLEKSVKKVGDELKKIFK